MTTRSARTGKPQQTPRQQPTGRNAVPELKPVLDEETEQQEQPDYAIDVRAFESSGKSFAYAVYTRMSERGMAQVGGAPDQLPQPLGSPNEYMKVIATVCSKEPDFLLPGTPISEAVFRLLLANNNKPMSLQQIQTGLTSAWASVIYLKNLSDDVVRRMLDQPNEYFIRRV
jgi:hypothetical protein